MRKLFTIVGLAALVATVGVGFTANEALAGHGGKKHHHHGGHGWGWGVGGFASGLALGYALNQPSQPTVVYQSYPAPVYYGCNPYNPYAPCYAPAPAYYPVQ